MPRSSGDNAVLAACAEALTARYLADGYINTRVLVQETPAPGFLDVLEGRIAEIRVRSSDPYWRRRIQRQLNELQGTILNVQRLESRLQQLRQLPGLRQISGS
ncbi:MAG: ShlB/FhaC/HecB family hemolysin secretion/activation protein, partial [Cyanobium sp.]